MDLVNVNHQYNRMRTDITLLDLPKDMDDHFAHGEATFGHLMVCTRLSSELLS